MKTEKIKIDLTTETNNAEPQIQNSDTSVKEENKMRAQIARVTQRSKQEVPHYYLSTDINMDKALEIRAQINSKLAEQNIKISINDLIIKAVIDTLKKFPVFNSRYENGTTNTNEEINVSIAIALEEGLIMPAIINCNDMDIKQLSIASKDLVDRTKNGKLTSAEYTKGTFSISNLGMFDVNSFLAIILPPQTAMLAVGSVKKVPIVTSDDDSAMSLTNAIHTRLLLCEPKMQKCHNLCQYVQKKTPNDSISISTYIIQQIGLMSPCD